MKKTLSIILCAVMLFCCIPFSVGAEATDPFAATGILPAGLELTENIYSIDSGVTITVAVDNSLFIPAGVTLTVKEGAKLIVNGNIFVYGSLVVEGTVVHAENIVTADGGSAIAKVTFPALDDAAVLLVKDGKDRVSVSYAFAPGEYDYLGDNFSWNDVPREGGTFAIPLNQYLFIKAVINEATDPTDPDYGYDKYDDSLFRVSLNSVGLALGSNVHSTLLTTAGDITYSKWTNDRDFYNAFNIYLPTGEGYTVRGRYGETSASTETVKLRYGEPFSFTVEIDEAYDMSDYKVYVYNGYGFTNLDPASIIETLEPAKPDEFGYYNIPRLVGDTTVYVVGVVKNETITLIGNIVEMLRNAFEMIKAFFEEIFNLFK